MITEKTRHLTASMVVLDPYRRSVLLVHHKATGKWVFPGGHVDPGETPAAAALREVLEETGVAAALTTLETEPYAVEPFAAPAKPARPGKPAEPPHIHLDLLFVGVAEKGPLTIAEDEVHAARWVEISALLELDAQSGVYHARADVYRVLAELGLS